MKFELTIILIPALFIGSGQPDFNHNFVKTTIEMQGQKKVPEYFVD